MKRFAFLLLIAAIASQAADSTATTASRDAHRARIEQAIATRDYDAWKAERQSWGAKGHAGDVVTRENFETFAKMHEAMKAGRTDEAATLRQQLGLGSGVGKHMGQGMGNGQVKGQGRHGNDAGNGQGKGHGGQGCMRQN